MKHFDLKFGTIVKTKHSERPVILVDGFDNPSIHGIIEGDKNYSSVGVSRADVVEVIGNKSI